MKWFRVIDELPQIPKNKYAVQVLAAEFDPCYDEINPGKGYTVRCVSWHQDSLSGEFAFMNLCSDNNWYPVCDVVTHWMYLPEPPAYEAEVLNPIFQHYHDTARPQSPLKQLTVRSERDIIEESYART